MSDLLEAAKKALPGLRWLEVVGGVSLLALGFDDITLDLPRIAIDDSIYGRPIFLHVARTTWECNSAEDMAKTLRTTLIQRRDALNTALGEQPARWVPVGERLPDIDRDVPLWTDRGLMFGSRGLVESETWLWADQYGDAEAFADVTVTHWLDVQPPEVQP